MGRVRGLQTTARGQHPAREAISSGRRDIVLIMKNDTCTKNC